MSHLSNEMLKHHFHPKKGWMNDPNGLCYYKGKYHLFYQHAPNFEYPWQEPIVWGHATTNDFIHFEELPIAIRPDKEYDTNGIWSGTAVEKDGKLYCYYASVDKDYKQTISLAVSSDGINFEKYEGNPIIRTYPADGSEDFRDPAILCCDFGNFLVIASGNKEKNTGNLLLYKSDNMTDWEYCGVLFEYENCKYCECPSFAKYGDGYLLAVSVCPNDGDHYFEVIYGSFDGVKFTAEIVSHFQKGPDVYAGQIFSHPHGNPLLISWIPGWKYQPKEKCIGCLSLPLELTVSRGKILAYPIEGLMGLLSPDGTLTDAYITEQFIGNGEEVITKINIE